MRIRAGRHARHARHELSEASGLDAIALDRLAAALALATCPEILDGDAPDLDRVDGDQHDVAALDDLSGQAVLSQLLAARAGGPLDTERLERDLRRLLNRGYELLLQRLEGCGSSWTRTVSALVDQVGVAPDSGGAREGDIAAIEVEIGRADGGDGPPIRWSVNDESGQSNNANTRLAGASGKGKSQVLLHLLAAIVKRSPQTGFILLDYKGDLHGDRAFVKATGARVITPDKGAIPINPFDLPPTVNRRLAPRAFAEVFAAVAPNIGPVQQTLLTQAMRRAYDRSVDLGQASPTLADVRDAVTAEYERAGRGEDTVAAVLRDVTELGLFAQRSLFSAEDLLQQRLIIDLSNLRALRDFAAFVLLEHLHNTAQGLPDARFDARRKTRALRCIVAVDEAHYYLERSRCQPLLSLIRIGRSKGTPVFLCSQSLEDFRGATELNELLANTFVFGHGVAPPPRGLAGALGIGKQQAAAVADHVTQLDQFMAYTNLARGVGTAAPRPVRLTPLFEAAKDR